MKRIYDALVENSLGRFENKWSFNKSTLIEYKLNNTIHFSFTKSIGKKTIFIEIH